jgi:hypothetical protein
MAEGSPKKESGIAPRWQPSILRILCGLKLLGGAKSSWFQPANPRRWFISAKSFSKAFTAGSFPQILADKEHRVIHVSLF